MILLEPLCLDSRNGIRHVVPLFYCPRKRLGLLAGST